MQVCYKNHSSNPTKFAKCADESFNKTQKHVEEFQYKLLFSKFDLVNCLVDKKEHPDKCKQAANDTVGKSKD